MAKQIKVLVLQYKNNKIASRAESTYSSDEALNQACEKAIADWKEAFKNASHCDACKFSNANFAHTIGPYLDLYARKDATLCIKEIWEITDIQIAIPDVADDIVNTIKCSRSLHKEIPTTELGCLVKTIVNGMSPRELGDALVKFVDEVAKTNRV